MKAERTHVDEWHEFSGPIHRYFCAGMDTAKARDVLALSIVIAEGGGEITCTMIPVASDETLE